MNIIITGATGFIGHHLLEDIDDSKYNITVLTRNPIKKIEALPINAKVVVADLIDYQSLEKAFEGIDVIINMAAEVRNTEKLAETNVVGSQNLVKAAKVNQVKKIIHLSSVGVVGMQYSSSEVIISENSVCHPINDYEKTKYKSEQILIDFCSENEIELSVLRPTNVFGEKHPLNAMLKLMNHINNNKMMIVSAQAKVNFIYVKDLTTSIIQLIEIPAKAVINIGHAVTYVELINMLNKILNRNSKILIFPNVFFKILNAVGIKKLNIISNQVIYSDNYLMSFFNYPYGLEKGLEKTFHYFQQKGDLK